MNRVKPSFWIFLGNKMPNINYFPASIGFFILIVSMVGLDSPSPTVQSQLPFVIGIALFVLGIGFFLQWKKFAELYSLFKTGAEVEGEIKEVYFFRGHGYIRFEYQYQQKSFSFLDSVNQNQRTKGVSVGQKKTVYVNSQNPAQACIRDLYLQTF